MGKVDLHSHLIPGLDDGVRTLDDALLVVDGLISRGYDRIMTTPHQVEYWRPGPDVMYQGLEELREAVARRGWPVRIGMGAENHLDEVFLQRMKQGSLLSYGLAGKAILIELSHFSPPPFFQQLVFDLRAAGVIPVLAHPERYPWLPKWGQERIQALRTSGCQLQVDLGSFSGAYGRQVRNAARQLVKWGVVDLVATDLHGPDKLAALVDNGWKALSKLVPASTIQQWGEETPGQIFDTASAGPWGPEPIPQS